MRKITFIGVPLDLGAGRRGAGSVGLGREDRAAEELGVGDHLLLGKGEDASGGRAKTSILADAMEAVIVTPLVGVADAAMDQHRRRFLAIDRADQLMAALGVRNIAGFNRRVKDAIDAGKPIRDAQRVDVPGAGRHPHASCHAPRARLTLAASR